MDVSWAVRTLLTILLAMLVGALSAVLFWIAPSDLTGEKHEL